MSHLSVNQILSQYSSYGEFCRATGGWHLPYMELDNGQTINARMFDRTAKKRKGPTKKALGKERAKVINQFLGETRSTMKNLLIMHSDFDLDAEVMPSEFTALVSSMSTFFSLPELTAEVKALPGVDLIKGANRTQLTMAWMKYQIPLIKLSLDTGVASPPSTAHIHFMLNTSLVRHLSYFLSFTDLARVDGVNTVFHHVVSDTHPIRSPWSRVTVTVSGYVQLARLRCHYMQRLCLSGRFNAKEFLAIRRASHTWRQLRFFEDRAKYTANQNDRNIYQRNLRNQTKLHLKDALAGDETPAEVPNKANLRPMEKTVQEVQEPNQEEEEEEQEDTETHQKKKKQKLNHH